MNQSNQFSLKHIFWKLLSRVKIVLTADYSFADLNIGSIKQRAQSATTTLGHFIIQSRVRLFTLLAVMGSIFLLLLVVLPYKAVLMDRFSIRPAQWGHLQNLIADSHALAISTSPQLPSEEFDLQVFKAMLLSRDIKLTNLALISGNPIKIELKANEVLFSALLDTLEQVRIRWHLYPEELNIQAGNLPGVVTIDGLLVQHLNPEFLGLAEGRR